MKAHWIRLTSLSAAAGVLAVCGLSSSGCETTKGVGRDIENTGSTMEHAVEGEDAEGTREDNPPPPRAR